MAKRTTQREKKTRGRPTHEPTKATREEVRNLSIGGATQDQICEILEIDRKTLAKHYKDILSTSKLKNNGNVIGKAYQMAVSGLHPALTIFWLKTQCRWQEKTQEHDLDRPISINIKVERQDTRPSELRRIAEREALARKNKANE